MTRALCLGLFCALESTASAQIFNGGFEQNGGSLTGWTHFNNVIPNVVADSITPHSGSYVAKVFGGFNGDPNFSGMHQSLPAQPEQCWQATTFARHNSGDSISGSNELLLKIEFYRVAGGIYGTPDMLSEHEIPVLNGSSPTDTWSKHSFCVTAPAETVEARLALVFSQFSNATGAALVDDVTLDQLDPDPPIVWEEIWSDDFGGDTIDLEKWRVEDLHLIKNNELQYYAPDDAYLENGNLILRSQERTYQGFDSDGIWGTYAYTSGLVESRDDFATAYGRIEVRAKLPSTQGIWPAHWMLPDSREWPPEIDIMELLGHEPERVYMTHHWGTWPQVQSNGGSFIGPDFSDDYHTFAVEWFPDKIDWYVDDVRRFTSTVATPQEPFYIILNTAVGGNWPGNPNGTTVFPQYHSIDYVKVFMPADPGTPHVEGADDDPGAPQVDGIISPGEYAWEIAGINDGFGDLIGENSVMSFDSGDGSDLHIGLQGVTAWPPTWQGGVVIYLDTIEGGFISTQEFDDTADVARRLVSGKASPTVRSDLYFPMGFLADYALCLQPQKLSLFRLNRDEHELINGADLGSGSDYQGGQAVTYQWDDGAQGQLHRELRLAAELVGITPGSSFNFLATTLNSLTAARSNEFMGVAPGNSWDGNNIGPVTSVLNPGDFGRFNASEGGPVAVPAVSEWSLLVMTLLIVVSGTRIFQRRAAF
ncbi:MAG: family 16 glycosylhydrolase [Planctomycetota bacterium]|jgi:beta-glucanase (GH16 family)